MAISMLKIRRPLGRNMGIAIPGKTVFLIETAPRLCDLAPVWGGVLPIHSSGIILCMLPSNGRWCYNVALSLIGWVHTQNDPCSLFPESPPGTKGAKTQHFILFHWFFLLHITFEYIWKYWCDLMDLTDSFAKADGKINPLAPGRFEWNFR